MPTPTPARRTLIFGGRVQTCDGVTTAQQALVLEAGRIVALGERDDMVAAAGHDPIRIDVQGATVLPGLVDTHPHAMHFAALGAACVDLSDARNHDDIVARISARAAQTPKGEWIMCTPVGEAHYFTRRSYRDLEERQLPDRHVLDCASSEHPIMIQAWAPRIPNVVAFNTAALQRLGLSWVTPRRVCDVFIERDGRNELTGILYGSVTNYYTHDPFWLQIWGKLPTAPDAIWPVAGRLGMNEMNRLGVTTIYESHVMEPSHISAYRELRAGQALTCRVKTSLEAAPQAFNPHFMPTEADLRARLALTASLTDLNDAWLRHDGITVARSGPCWPGFLNWHEPFKSPYGELVHGYEFLPKWVEEMAVDYCMDEGVRMNILAATGKDHDNFFHSVAKHAAAEIRKRGWILQHAIFVSEADARRYAALDMCVTTSKGFHWGKGDMYVERIGPHVKQDIVPLKRWLDHGVTVGCGTDWGPRNVFEQIALAETCEFGGSGYHNLEVGQALTRGQAILMWTRDAARVLDWHGVGTIASGNHADITIVDRDPFTCDVQDLPSTQVLATMVDGAVVHDGGALKFA